MNRSMIAVAGLLLASCASTPPEPTSQLAVSRSAVTQAERANALQYAPVELTQAQEKLRQAQAAVGREDYAAARRLAEQAEVDARLAETKTHSTRAQAALSEVNESIRVLQEELKRN